jgi:hypothetical protein
MGRGPVDAEVNKNAKLVAKRGRKATGLSMAKDGWVAIFAF